MCILFGCNFITSSVLLETLLQYIGSKSMHMDIYILHVTSTRCVRCTPNEEDL
ncbi:hypothetical protein Syun_013167 [Stephania yunnanensis]|uniref:Uncharacterized protein n=1 Tax=Stephania yunnanensis TaxID=152371 RepID=A0AAP0PH28_9MAGN